MTSTDLTGRVAVVTGASGGLGAATARLLAARGAKVALLARRADELDALVAGITADGGDAIAIPTDVTVREEVVAAAARIHRELGTVSIVFNNAGVMLPSPVTEHATAKNHLQIDLNAAAVVDVIEVFVDDLIASAAAGGAADLVNTSSLAAQQVFPTFAVYGATKAFVSHLTRHLHAELGPLDVRVTMLEPGIVATDLWDEEKLDSEGASSFYDGASGAMDLVKPEEIAEIVGFVVGLPRHVNIQQLAVLPTRQA